MLRLAASPESIRDELRLERHGLDNKRLHRGRLACEFRLRQQRALSPETIRRQASRLNRHDVRPQSGQASGHISAAMTFLRVAKSGRNIGQPDHSPVNPVTSYKAERRPGSSEIWLAVTKDDGMQVDSIFIDQAKFG